MSIRLGNNPVVKLSIGAQIISRVYVKSNIVYSGEWTPFELFAANEPGVWYDPSDFSTMFQDSAGTIPVTAVEQPVGLMLDKSGNGNHAYQTTATSRPVLSARYNLLTKTEVISAADWAHYNIASRTTTKFIPSTAYAEHYISNSTSKAATAIQYSARFDVKDEGYVFAPIVVGDWSGVVASNGWYFCVNLSDGSYTTPGTFGSGWSTGTVTITRDSITGICTVLLSFTTSAVSTRVGVGIYAHPTSKAQIPFAFYGNDTSGVYCSKIDLRVANAGVNLPPYQRVNTATDYDTVGFPHYLRFDGVDDWLVTNTITPGTDKAQVFAGVRKLSDAATGIVYELSTATQSVFGGFYLAAPNTLASASYQISTRSSGGGNMSLNVTGIPAPITNVSTSLYDLSVSSVAIRFNGITNKTRTGGAGGVFGNYPLYIGRRAGTTYPFNGHIYSLIVRFGNNLPAPTIENTEKYINGLTKAY